MATMAGEHEQREFTRVPISFGVEVSVDGRALEGCLVHDLSMKGMLVVTPERFPIGTPCSAVIVLVEGEVEIRMSGRVAADHPEGFGMEFSTIDGLESYIHLRNLVLFNAGDVDRVEGEFQSHAGIRRKA
ncbi:pilus protein PilZ [Mesoterricola sediminis]|uniref:Pilus protein PilZ n=2 Tax=Mesoterricola sediminis TaxID=2927980 RepID=A0AA48KCI6_9BACT|nr:pilus protein PilZ [Mesoterricola sediminis]